MVSCAYLTVSGNFYFWATKLWRAGFKNKLSTCKAANGRKFTGFGTLHFFSKFWFSNFISLWGVRALKETETTSSSTESFKCLWHKSGLGMQISSSAQLLLWSLWSKWHYFSRILDSHGFVSDSFITNKKKKHFPRLLQCCQIHCYHYIEHRKDGNEFINLHGHLDMKNTFQI